jgi:hypothetical protein
MELLISRFSSVVWYVVEPSAKTQHQRTLGHGEG